MCGVSHFIQKHHTIVAAVVTTVYEIGCNAAADVETVGTGALVCAVSGGALYGWLDNQLDPNADRSLTGTVKSMAINAVVSAGTFGILKGAGRVAKPLAKAVSRAVTRTAARAGAGASARAGIGAAKDAAPGVVRKAAAAAHAPKAAAVRAAAGFEADSSGSVNDVRGLGRPDNQVVFSGHGGIDAGDTATTRVPKGTCVAFYCAHGGYIYDDVANAIETGSHAPRRLRWQGQV